MGRHGIRPVRGIIHAHSHAAATIAATTATFIPRFVPIRLAPSCAPLRARRPLQWNYDIVRHRPQVERAADKAAQADDQFGRMDRTARRQVAGRLPGQAAVFFGTEQQDIRQGGFDRVADAACALGTGGRGIWLPFPAG